MRLTALHRKLLREMLRLRGQIATIAVVLACGIVCFVSMRGTYDALANARIGYYDRYRFAHVFARVERAPEELARRIELLPGVETVQTRVVKEVTLPIEGMARPAYGTLLSLPAAQEPLTNALCLRKGRFPVAGRDDELVVLESFAQAHGLEPGMRVPVILNRKQRQMRIVGIALSSEFIYSIRPGAFVDDPRRNAVLWMERTALSSAFQLDGAFNEVSLRLSPGASEQGVRIAVDRLLAPYGGDGAIGRKEQISNRIVMQELDQLHMLSTMVPAVFLGVSAFLVNLVLGRLIRLQRPEIATLKAIGYSNHQVGIHYLGLILIVLLPGAIGGTLGGYVLGRFLLGLYGQTFRFPDLHFRLSAALVGFSVLVSGAAATLGALGAVRHAIKLPPAEAMQPPAPARYRRNLIETLGLGALAGPSGLMILREVLRRPLRTIASSLGIAGAVSLLILGHFGWDSILSYFEGTFQREQRQDLAVVFDRPVEPDVIEQLRHVSGVLTAEGLRAIPIRVRHDHRSRESVLMGVPPGATLRRLVGRGGHAVAIPEDGVILTKTLGEILNLRIGDRVDVETRQGDRRLVHPVVVGFVDEAVGLQAYAQTDAIATLEGDLGAVSSALLKVDPQALEDVEAHLRRSPRIVDVADATSDMQRMLDMNASFINVWTVVSVLLSASVVFGVVYNNARIALAARSRDLASLRVLGLTRGEVSLILLGTQFIEVGIAVPLGLALGLAWSKQFMKAVDQETFRWTVVVAPSTYLLAISVTLLAAAASALWVRRNVDTLDLISVLKARE